MGNIKKETIILRMIYGTSFLKFVLQDSNFPLEMGYLLVAEDSKSTSGIIHKIKQLDDTVIYRNWNTQSTFPLNYETGFLHYNHYIKESAVYNFLQQENFLPIVIIDGIVPEFLRNVDLIIPFEITENSLSDFLLDYRSFKCFVVENLGYIIREINLFKTENIYNCNNVSSNVATMYRSLIVVGKMWKIFERNNGFCEQIYDMHYQQYITFITELLSNTERFEDDYEIQEAIRSVVISYVEKNSILIVDTTQIANETLEEIKRKRVILQDRNFYYFPEKFFKTICKPLLESVSFLQLKNEMHKEGILICDDGKQKNFTVKKMFYNNDTKEACRMRFLKFPKEIFETDRGLPLEMIVNTNPQTNIVKIFKPKGGIPSCT